MYILGLSGYYHDSAACLLKDGVIVAAAQEERFSRKKNDATFPLESIKFCLELECIDASKVDYVVFYEKPFLKFERLLETYFAIAPKGFYSFLISMPIWIKEKLFLKRLLIKELSKGINNSINWKKRLLFSSHHLSHAASAFYPSPFENAAVLTMDAVGEWATTSVAIGEGKNLKIIKEINFPHSIGLLYSTFTSYLGFKVNSGEYKVMGLAPYGEPKYADLIMKHLIYIADDGSFSLNMDYFGYLSDLTMTNKEFCNLFGGEPRTPETPLTQRDMDLASSIQTVTEELVLTLAKNIAKETKQKNLCLAGGVALNCVVNGILLRKKIFKNIWIQPAAGDAGGSLGAAFVAWFLYLGKERFINSNIDQMSGSFLGPEFSSMNIENTLKINKINFTQVSEDILIDSVIKAIMRGKTVGWMQGKMEFGPRALGARSILADPRSPEMHKHLNMKIKFRESFRPFAPSILQEHVQDWFDDIENGDYMQFVTTVKKSKRSNISISNPIDQLYEVRSEIPAVTHVDFSARVHTVNQKTNKKFHALISAFYEKTGCPILINTSFNVRGEPIVCSPVDAINCFMNTDLDLLAMGDFLIFKDDQPSSNLKKII